MKEIKTKTNTDIIHTHKFKDNIKWLCLGIFTLTLQIIRVHIPVNNIENLFNIIVKGPRIPEIFYFLYFICCFTLPISFIMVCCKGNALINGLIATFIILTGFVIPSVFAILYGLLGAIFICIGGVGMARCAIPALDDILNIFDESNESSKEQNTPKGE